MKLHRREFIRTSVLGALGSMAVVKTAKGSDSLKSIEFEDIFNYVVTNKNFKLDIYEFYVIHNGFREKWNKSTDNLVGDGDFKNFVYRHIENEYEKHKSDDYIPQENVDACVDLILDYMESIGQWYLVF